MTLLDYASWAAAVFEFAGITVMLLGSLWAPLKLIWRRRLGLEGTAFQIVRKALALAILLGLELLVAADIVRTISEDPEIYNVLVLGLIVLIRTFLSVTLDVELEGTWPWKRSRRSSGPGEGPAEVPPR